MKTAGGGDASWVDVQSYLDFASDAPAYANVSAGGLVVVHDNTVGDDVVTITVASSLDEGVAATKTLAVNLQPSAFDVDMGNPTGAPFYFTCGASSDEFDLPVRIHTGGSPLTAFQIVIEFDSDVISAASAAPGDDWTATFDATLNDPVTQVQIIGAGGSVTGSAVEIAVLTFSCAGSGATTLSGVVIETLTSDNELLGSKNRAIVSGDGILSTDATDRRQLMEVAATATPTATAAAAARLAPAARRSLAGGCNLTGDVNWDCSVTVTDLSWVKTYLAGGSLAYDDEDAQVAAMDVDMNGLVDAVDASFLLYSLGNKYRFRSGELRVEQTGDDTCGLVVRAGFTYSDGAPVAADGKTKILLEVATTLNAAHILSSAASAAAATASDDGVVLTMTAQSDGNFSATLSLPFPEDVAFAVLMYTFDSTGATDTQRRFPWFGSSFGDFGDAGFTFDAVATTEYTCCIDADSDGLCSNGARADDPCPTDDENDADSDGTCAELDSCPYDAGNDVDSDAVCGDVDLCPLDSENDADGDAVCETVDSCPYDNENDADSDHVCELHYCQDDVAFRSPVDGGSCLSYADSRHNFGHCAADGACDACACTCAVECNMVDPCSHDAENDADSDTMCADVDPCPHDSANDADSDDVCGDVDSCPYDPLNDQDGDGLCVVVAALCVDDVTFDTGLGSCRSYAPGMYNAGRCALDGACTACPCACAVECGLEDPCPLDVNNDADSDGVCGSDESCPLDTENDVDGDYVCANVDSCPHDAANDADSDTLCAPVDSCPFDAENDADGDGVCEPDDLCARDGQNDADSDGICGNIDSCPLDAANDYDGDGVCGNDDACPLDRENDFDSDRLCADVDACPHDANNDEDSDGLCAPVDSCPLDDENDWDGDALCGDADRCPYDAENDADDDGVCAAGTCRDEVGWDAGFGLCASYTRANKGHCVSDGACADGGHCGCSCASECGTRDVCPHDAGNDADSDGICGDVDSCPEDAHNDFDGDGVCGDADPCAFDLDNDADSDGLCETVDSCPNDAANDADSDALCAGEDACPLDADNDIDGDALCATVDSCPFDPDNDFDGDGACADAYGAADVRLVKTLEIMCLSGEMAAILSSNFSISTVFDPAASEFGTANGAVNAEIRMRIADANVDISSDINDDLGSLLAARLQVQRFLLELDVRLVHQVVSRARRHLAAAAEWDLLILVNVAFDDCLNDPSGRDLDSDLICFAVDSCPEDAQNDLDGDGLCESDDDCWYDANNDADGDGLCDSDVALCWDDPDMDVGYGRCNTYATDEHNDGRCMEHGVCEVCGCACHNECTDACPADAENDADSDGLCSTDDSCPYDAENDADADGVCGDVDVCANDWFDDFDGDGVCGDVDACPWRTDIIARTAMEPNLIGSDLVCSTDGLDEIILFTFIFDDECASEVAAVSWQRACDDTRPCVGSPSDVTESSPSSGYNEQVIDLLAYSLENAYTEVYGSVPNEPNKLRDTPVALQFYDIGFDESASLDADNEAPYLSYVFKVQVPYNATLDQALAVDQMALLAANAGLTEDCVPDAGVPVVAYVVCCVRARVRVLWLCAPYYFCPLALPSSLFLRTTTTTTHRQLIDAVTFRSFVRTDGRQRNATTNHQPTNQPTNCPTLVNQSICFAPRLLLPPQVPARRDRAARGRRPHVALGPAGLHGHSHHRHRHHRRHRAKAAPRPAPKGPHDADRRVSE